MLRLSETKKIAKILFRYLIIKITVSSYFSQNSLACQVEIILYFIVMNKLNESHAERFENDKPDSLNKRPSNNVSINNIRMRKFNDIRQYISKKLPKSRKKIPSTHTSIEELLDTLLTTLASNIMTINTV